ncbi:MAG TPA: Uma2 family endonuclease [Thermoanaerobaculia bacterium]|nr:Uma2 family endonuclease [Thermoanaerobaculia bacterium]HXT52391.1 Uma2 family endonuclease [Thermoanaerobaculia bacterium]
MERSVAQGATKLTYDDFLLFPDDGKRHELIDGEHFVSPTPLLRHQRILLRLAYEIETFLRQHLLGELIIAPMDVIFTRFDVVEPDLLYISHSRSHIKDKWVHGAPDLVVEILSPSNRRYDEVTKRDLYDRTGVPEYWIVDPEAETVKVFRREGERFGRPQLLSTRDEDALGSPQLPGLAIPLAALFVA